MSEHSDLVRQFILDLKRRGYTKMDVIKEVRVEFDIGYGSAYKHVNKCWDMVFADIRKIGST